MHLYNINNNKGKLQISSHPDRQKYCMVLIMVQYSNSAIHTCLCIHKNTLLSSTGNQPMIYICVYVFTCNEATMTTAPASTDYFLVLSTVPFASSCFIITFSTPQTTSSAFCLAVFATSGPTRSVFCCISCIFISSTPTSTVSPTRWETTRHFYHCIMSYELFLRLFHTISCKKIKKKYMKNRIQKLTDFHKFPRNRLNREIIYHRFT